MPIAARLKACPDTIIIGKLHHWQTALLANYTTADYSTVRLAV
jgi:hypothetical protein